MFVDIKLYMTTIDEENLFVGSSQENRELSLNSLRVQTEIIKAPFNPTDPFRLEGNYLEYQRKYNYARFKYYVNNDDTEPSVTRYYFIRDFEYVNDMVCRMVCDEDLVSNIFWQLKFARFYPSMCTYNSNKLTAKKRTYKEIETTELFNTVSENNLLLKNSKYALGFVIFSCLVDKFQTYWDPEFDTYTENGLMYPFYNVILPFIYDTQTESIIQGREQPQFYFQNSNGTETEIFNISHFQEFASNLLAGFKIISSMITTSTKGIAGFSINSTSDPTKIVINQVNDGYEFKLQPLTTGGDNPQPTSVKALTVKKGNTTQVLLNSLSIDEYSVPAYKKANILAGSSTIELDLRRINQATPIYFEQSLLPPYVYTVSWVDEANQYTANNFNQGQTDTAFMDYKEQYAEWYRSNYNAQITGLKVKQQTEQGNLGIRTATGLASTILGIGTTLVGGNISASINKNMAAPQLAGLNAIKQAGNFALDTMGNYMTLNNNQAKERKLQELQIQDIRNTPDNVSFNSSLGVYIRTKQYVRLMRYENVFLDQIKAYHKAYGFESMIDISDSFQQHTLFDYYRADDTVLNTDEVFLDEMERSQVEDTFSKGVRVWYDYNNMKNFTIENPEKAV